MTATESTPENQPAKILLVDDSEHDRRFFRRTLERSESSFQITECGRGEDALETLEAGHFDVLIADLNMPGMDGLQLIDEAREYLADTAVMILSGARDFEAARKAVRLHVFDYVLKEPTEALRETLPQQVFRALDHIRLLRENRRLQRELSLRVAYLEQMQRLLPDALLAIVDHERRVIEINEQARTLLDLPPDAPLRGRKIDELLDTFSPGLGERLVELHNRKQEAHNQYVEAPSRNDADRLLLLNWTKVGGQDDPGHRSDPCCVLSLTDVTPEPVKVDTKATGYHGIVGNDPRIEEMCDLIRRVAPLPTSVLITGPTGSGKEVVARAIHEASDRRSKPFIAVNCTALSREILESELFGHVRGAFTGAVAPRKGRFREADGGTLLLDEIGDTTESFQTKLLRTLEAGKIEPVGQDRPVKVDVRILCATNKDLKDLVRQGRFREDLFYRINVVQVEVPPLADRPGDLPLLIEMYRREFNQRFRKSIRLISQDAMRVLARHDWPGNVRELRHVLEHAFVVTDGPTITRADLPPALTGASSAIPRSRTSARPESVQTGEEKATGTLEHTSTRVPPRAKSDQAEIARIQEALAECGGSIGGAAKHLEMHRTTLWRKMRQYGIES